MKGLFIIHKDKLNQARKWDVHILAIVRVTVVACLADRDILSTRPFYGTAQRHD